MPAAGKKVSTIEAMFEELATFQAGDEGAEAVVAFVGRVLQRTVVDDGHADIIRQLDGARSQIGPSGQDAVDDAIVELRLEERRVLGLTEDEPE